MFETLIILGVIGLFVWISRVSEQRYIRSFKRRWPAITEEEFVAKCSPGTNPKRALRVRRIIADHLGIPYEHIHPEQKFVDTWAPIDRGRTLAVQLPANF